jgi:imidazolonepropionase-like amidohydrolase
LTDVRALQDARVVLGSPVSIAGIRDSKVAEIEGNMADSQLTVISGGRVLVGAELEPRDDVTVLVEDGTIAAVGSDIDIAGEATVVDTSDHTVLPGFIDAHVHIGFADPADLLSRGITTARDLAWPPDEIWPLVQRSKASDFDGPELLAAGPMLTAPGGYPTRAAWAPPGTGLEVRDPSAAERAVAAVAEQGASIVKIALNPPVGPVLDETTLTAIVEAAHARGLRVTGHIYGLDELHKAIRAGVDELAHMLMSDEALPDETVAEMVTRGMTIVPTLCIREHDGRSSAIDNLARFAGAGGTVIYGTDLGNEGPVPGIDPTEIDSMLAAGMSPRDVIASATTIAAAWLGLDDRGAIAPGKRADLIAVPGDPLEDAAVLSRVAMVWRGG